MHQHSLILRLCHAVNVASWQQMLAAQEVVQARRHFIKVIGIEQVADSLVISQT